MIGVAKEERDLPVLQLHNWANFPLAISLYSEAALSPSRSKLLLLSRNDEALFVPLGSVSDKTFSVPGQLGSCSSSGPRLPSSFSALLDIECFSWACSGEENGSNQTPGPFRELLLTGGKEGLIIHAFCNKSAAFDKTEDTVGQGAEVSPQLHPRSKQSSGSTLDDESSGSWRNWGLGEFKRRQELWRRLEEQFVPDQEKNDESCRNYEEGFRCSDSNNAKGCERVRQSKSLEGVVRDCYSLESGGTGCEECRGLESFAVDASIEGNECEASLMYEKNHSWPQSAEVISFRIVQGSGALSRLVSLSQKTSVESQTYGNASSGQKNDASTSRFSSSGWTRLKNGYFSTPRRREGRYEVSGIISSPSQSLVAIVFSTFPSCKSRLLETLERDHSDSSREGFPNKRCKKRWKGSSDLRVTIATVHSWGLIWSPGIDFACARKDARIPTEQWADFKLSMDKFLGLTESGFVYFWTAITGNYIACIDAFQFCRVTFGPKARMSTELNVGAKSALYDTSNQLPERVIIEIAKEGRPDSGVAGASCLEPVGKHRFVQLVVTADCKLIAISNDQGLVFLLSVDESILAYFQPSCTDFIPSERYSRVQALSSWEAAGLSISGAAPIEGPLKYQMKTRLSSPGQKPSMTPKREEAMVSSCEDCTIYSASLGSSGFTSRLNHEEKKLTGTVNSSPKLLRNVFLPLNPKDSFVEMALNPHSITRLMVDFKNTSKFTVVQSELRIAGGSVDEATLTSRELSSVQERIIKQHRYEGEVLSFASQGCLYLVTATALHVVLPPLALSSSKSGLAVGSEGSRWPNGTGIQMFSSKWDGMLPLLTRPHVQQWQAEVQVRSLIFDGPEETERLCDENGKILWFLKLHFGLRSFMRC